MNLCLCGCEKEVNNLFVSGHNARVLEYTSGQFVKGKKTWNGGLTKETDERIAKMVEKQIGSHPTEETRRKLSESHKGYVPLETTRKIWSEQRKGEGNPFYGKTHSEENKRKSREQNKGNKYHLGYKHSEESRELMSIKQKEVWSDPEHKSKMLEHLTSEKEERGF